MTESTNLTLHQFRVFDAVARNGSLTQAALALDIPQPSISRLIARLEREIGTALLDRYSTGVTLTAAGERFYENALQAMHFHDLAIEEARASTGLLMGKVRIAAPDSVGGVLFAPLVQAFKADHDAVSLRTIASQSAQIPGMLASGSIDLGIVADTHQQPTGISLPLFREALYLIGPKSTEPVAGETISLEATASLPLVLNAMPGGFRSLIDDSFAQLGIKPRVEIEIDANNALLDLLVEGAGYSILPYSLLASARATSALGAARLVNPDLIRTLSIVTASNRPMSALLRETVRRLRSIANQQATRARWLPIEPPD